jgi:ribosome-associated protein
LKSLALAKKVAYFASEKQAENVVVLDMRDIANFCDYFVLCTASSSRHIRAVADGVDEGLHELGMKIKFKQGLETASRSRGFSFSNQGALQPEAAAGAWVLLDMGDVVAHVFDKESREFYALDHLWQEAVAVKWQ